MKALVAGVVFLLSAAVAAGGGFWLTTYSAKAPVAAGIADTAVVLAVEGCHDPANVKMTGTAEGLVQGQRRSVPLVFTPTSKHGVFAIKKQWPAEGVWVLAVTASLPGIAASAVVEPQRDGAAKILSPRNMAQSVSAQEIETALKKAAATAS